MQTYEEIKQQFMAGSPAQVPASPSILDSAIEELETLDGEETGKSSLQSTPKLDRLNVSDVAAVKGPVNKPILIMMLIGGFLATSICVAALISMNSEPPAKTKKHQTKTSQNSEPGFFDWFLGKRTK